MVPDFEETGDFTRSRCLVPSGSVSLMSVRRARAGDQGAVVAYADDDEQALKQFVAERERMGAELVVVVRSLARRPTGEPPPWS